MIYWSFIVLFFLIFAQPIFGQSIESDNFTNSKYMLEINNQNFAIPYSTVADVIAMKIDPESSSLLIGIKNAVDSEFVISLENELISAENHEFIILVNGEEVDYGFKPESDLTTFSFFIPIDTEEVEIIGTRVIPEFPLGVFAIFIVMISVVMLFTKTKPFFFK